MTKLFLSTLAIALLGTAQAAMLDMTNPFAQPDGMAAPAEYMPTSSGMPSMPGSPSFPEFPAAPNPYQEFIDNGSSPLPAFPTQEQQGPNLEENQKNLNKGLASSRMPELPKDMNDYACEAGVSYPAVDSDGKVLDGSSAPLFPTF